MTVVAKLAPLCAQAGIPRPQLGLSLPVNHSLPACLPAHPCQPWHACLARPPACLLIKKQHRRLPTAPPPQTPLPPVVPAPPCPPTAPAAAASATAAAPSWTPPRRMGCWRTARRRRGRCGQTIKSWASAAQRWWFPASGAPLTGPPPPLSSGSKLPGKLRPGGAQLVACCWAACDQKAARRLPPPPPPAGHGGERIGQPSAPLLVLAPPCRSGKDWTEAVQRLYQPRMQDLLPKADALGPSPPYNLSAFVPEVRRPCGACCRVQQRLPAAAAAAELGSA